MEIKKVFSILGAIVFFAVGVYLFYQFGYSEGDIWRGPRVDLQSGLLASCLPLGLSVLFLVIGLTPGKKTVEEKKEEKRHDSVMSLMALRDKGLISEEEYQLKLKMTRNGVQNLMDDLKSLRDGGILTEEEYQQKVNQLLK